MSHGGRLRDAVRRRLMNKGAHTMDSISFTPGSTRHLGRLTLVALAVAAFLSGVVPSLASAKNFHGQIMSAATARKAAKQDPNSGMLSAPARRALRRGYLVPNQGRYDREKERAARGTAAREALTAPVSGPLAPSL